MVADAVFTVAQPCVADALTFVVVVSVKLGLQVIKKGAVNNFVQFVHPRICQGALLRASIPRFTTRYERRNSVPQNAFDFANLLNPLPCNVADFFLVAAPSEGLHCFRL